MIRYIEGDIFKSPAQVLVNTVNTVGVMGKGIALEFKKRYPDMFRVYRDICDKRNLKTGSLLLCYEPDHWVLLFPTKEHWRNPSQLDYIEKGLDKFSRTYADKGITSIAFPRLGCGNGELKWDDVRPVMEKYLDKLPIDVYIYIGVEGNTVPEHKNQEKTVAWLRRFAKDMSFQGVVDDIRYNYSIAPLEFKSGEDIWCVLWNEGLHFQKNNDIKTVTIDENSFYDYWAEIRSSGIIAKQNIDSGNRLMGDMFLALGYFSEVNFADSEDKNMVEGYQINAGEGRVFNLKGYSDEL